MDDCPHRWACPGLLTIPGEGGVTILVTLYCTRCSAVQTKVAPPPEQPKIARAQIVPPGIPANAGRR